MSRAAGSRVSRGSEAVSDAAPTPSHDNLYARGIVLVLLAGTAWSIAGLVVRLMHDVSEWQILLYRSLGLVVTLLAFIAIRSAGAVVHAFRAAGATAASGGLVLSGAFACWIFAMTHTTIANALFVLAAAPFIAAFLACIFLREPVRPVTLACMLTALAGIGLMVGEGIAVGSLAGNLFALGAATGFAGFSVILRAGRARDMTPAVCWAGLWGTALAAAMVGLGARGFAVSAHDLALCLLLGAVQVGLGLILYTIGSRQVPAGELALLSMTEVVLGPIWVWLGVGEVPSLYTLVGGAIVLGAITAQGIVGVRRQVSPRGA